MEQDTFGFSRLVSEFGFSFTLEPASDGTTRVGNETHYRTRRGPLSAVMNRTVLRRKFRGVRRRWLANLTRLSEAVAAGDRRSVSG